MASSHALRALWSTGHAGAEVEAEAGDGDESKVELNRASFGGGSFSTKLDPLLPIVGI